MLLTGALDDLSRESGSEIHVPPKFKVRAPPASSPRACISGGDEVGVAGNDVPNKGRQWDGKIIHKGGQKIEFFAQRFADMELLLGVVRLPRSLLCSETNLASLT